MKRIILLGMLFFINIHCFASNAINDSIKMFYNKGEMKSIQQKYHNTSVLLNHRINELNKIKKAKACVALQRQTIKETKGNINFWVSDVGARNKVILKKYSDKMATSLNKLANCQTFLLENLNKELEYQKYVSLFYKYPLFVFNDIIKLSPEKTKKHITLEKITQGYQMGSILFYLTVIFAFLYKWLTPPPWNAAEKEINCQVKATLLVGSGAILCLMLFCSAFSYYIGLNYILTSTLSKLTIAACGFLMLFNGVLYSKKASIVFNKKSINCYLTYFFLLSGLFWMFFSTIVITISLNFLTSEISPFLLTTVAFLIASLIESWLFFLLSIKVFKKNIIYNVILVMIYQGGAFAIFIHNSYPQIIFIPVLLALIVFFKTIIFFIYNIARFDNPTCKRICKFFLITKNNKLHELSLLSYILCLFMALRSLSVIFLFDLRRLIFTEYKVFNTTMSISQIAIALLVFLTVRLFIKTIANFLFPNDSQPTDEAINYNSSYQLSLYIGTALALILAFIAAGFNADGFILIMGALSVGIGIGLRGIIANVVSGLILHFENPVKVGDYIQIDNHEGRVIKTGVRSTQIKTLTNIDVFIPNESLISENILNYSSDSNGSKILIHLGIAYDSDVEKISGILYDVLENTPGVIMKDPMGNPITRVFFEKISDYELTIKLAVALENIKKKEVVRTKINSSILTAFSKHGIKLPYPKHNITLINEENK